MGTLGEQEVYLEKHPDPRVRKDGLCVVCSKPRKMAIDAESGRLNVLKGVDLSIYGDDPFCSTECCKVWHGVKQRKEAS